MVEFQLYWFQLYLISINWKSVKKIFLKVNLKSNQLFDCKEKYQLEMNILSYIWLFGAKTSFMANVWTPSVCLTGKNDLKQKMVAWKGREAGLLNKRFCLAPALGVTEFITVTSMIWVTLKSDLDFQQTHFRLLVEHFMLKISNHFI